MIDGHLRNDKRTCDLFLGLWENLHVHATSSRYTYHMGLIRNLALEVHSDEHRPTPISNECEPKTDTDCEEVRIS